MLKLVLAVDLGTIMKISLLPPLYNRIILIWIFSVQLRRERIAERIRALQELVPSVNKVSVIFLHAR